VPVGEGVVVVLVGEGALAVADGVALGLVGAAVLVRGGALLVVAVVTGLWEPIGVWEACGPSDLQPDNRRAMPTPRAATPCVLARGWRPDAALMAIPSSERCWQSG
jgi:hypothetical protein